LRHVTLIQNHQYNLSKQERLPHFSCKAMQVTTRTDFQLGIATPDLIHHFFTNAIPAITRFEAIPPQHERHRRLRRILPNHLFSAQCTVQLFPHARSIDRSDPAARGGSSVENHLGGPSPAHRKPDFVSVCLEMCPILICFHFSPSYFRLTASVLLVCYLSFSCSFIEVVALQTHLISFNHYTPICSYISKFWDRGQIGDPAVQIECTSGAHAAGKMKHSFCLQ
jgi:hypothetical protein